MNILIFFIINLWSDLRQQTVNPSRMVFYFDMSNLTLEEEDAVIKIEMFQLNLKLWSKFLGGPPSL